MLHEYLTYVAFIRAARMIYAQHVYEISLSVMKIIAKQ